MHLIVLVKNNKPAQQNSNIVKTQLLCFSFLVKEFLEGEKNFNI